MKRRERQQEPPRKLLGSDDEGSVLRGFRDFRDWVSSRLAEQPTTLSEESKQVIRSLDSSKLVSWFRKLFDQAAPGEKGGVLSLMALVLPADAGPFCREVVDSADGRLRDKMLAAEILRKIDPEAVDGESLGTVFAAWQIVEAVFRAMDRGDGEGGVLDTDLLHAFGTLPGKYQAGIVAELYRRDSERSIPFVGFLLERRRELWEQVLDLLAENPHEGAAQLIRAGYEHTEDKALKKKMKKVNHKRRAKGLPAFALQEEEEGRVVWRPPVPPKPEGLLSISEASPGSRMVWLIRSNVPRGMLVFTAFVHDRGGLMNFVVADMSRREAEKYRQSVLESEKTGVASADPQYCAYVMEEAYGLGRPARAEDEEAFKNFRPLLRELLGQNVPRHPVYQAVPMDNDGQMRVDPPGESAWFLHDSLLSNWWVDSPQVQGQLEKLEEIRNSRIIVHPMQKQERTEAFLREGAREIFSSPEERRRWKVRLEDMALISFQKGEKDKAKRLIRMGVCLANPDQDVSRLPFFLFLLRRTLEGSLREKKMEEEKTPSLIVMP